MAETACLKTNKKNNNPWSGGICLNSNSDTTIEFLLPIFHVRYILRKYISCLWLKKKTFKMFIVNIFHPLRACFWKHRHVTAAQDCLHPLIKTCCGILPLPLRTFLITLSTSLHDSSWKKQMSGSTHSMCLYIFYQYACIKHKQKSSIDTERNANMEWRTCSQHGFYFALNIVLLSPVFIFIQVRHAHTSQR